MVNGDFNDTNLRLPASIRRELTVDKDLLLKDKNNDNENDDDNDNDNDNGNYILLSPSLHLKGAYGGSALLLDQFHQGKLGSASIMIMITKI